MNAIYRDALRRVFPSVSWQVALAGGVLLLLLMPWWPWWVTALLMVTEIGLLLWILSVLYQEAQTLMAERATNRSFVPLEPLDNLTEPQDDDDRRRQ